MHNNNDFFSRNTQNTVIEKKIELPTEKYKEKRNREKRRRHKYALNINPFKRTAAISFACLSNPLREFF